jgi:hypothetical protein
VNGAPLPQAEPDLVEPTPAPEVFVDGYHSFSTVGGSIKLAFFTMQHDVASNRMVRRIVLRLTMPMGVAVGVSGAFAGSMAQLEANMSEAAHA